MYRFWGCFAAVFLASCAGITPPAGNEVTYNGKTLEASFVLVPLPFWQKSDPVNISAPDSERWFVLYAGKNQTLDMKFSRVSGDAVLAADVLTEDGTQVGRLKASGSGESNSEMIFNPEAGGTWRLRFHVEPGYRRWSLTL